MSPTADRGRHLRASACSEPGSLRQEVTIDGGRHVLTTDEPEHLGGTDSGPAPHELFPAALASCVSTTIVMYARARSWEIGRVQVDAQDQSTPLERFRDLLRGAERRHHRVCPASDDRADRRDRIGEARDGTHEAGVVHGNDDRAPIGPEDPPHAVRLLMHDGTLPHLSMAVRLRARLSLAPN